MHTLGEVLMLGLCPHPVAVTVKGRGVQQGQKAQEHIQRPQEALEFKVLVLFNHLVRVVTVPCRPIVENQRRAHSQEAGQHSRTQHTT